MSNYDEKLSQICFYKLHPEYLPFVGDKYDDYRILHIGESHYIGQDDGKDEFPLDYFEQHWWSNHCDKLHGTFGGWYNTRNVLNNYLSGERRKGHSIFTNMIKVFNEVYLGEGDISISYEESQKYHNFAFMNFYQMPSLYKGKNYWDSLWAAATKVNNEQLALDMYKRVADESSIVLDAVIEILNPRVIIFTSKAARGAYNGKHAQDSTIIESGHPGSPWWNRKNKSGKSGREMLVEKLTEYKNTLN